MSRKHPGYGQGAASLDDVEALEVADIKSRLLLVFQAPGYVPPVLPRVGLQLLELSRRPDVDIPTIVRLLEQDALIAAAVLRQAQSALYSRGGEPIHSLHEAVVRLGLRTVSDLFLEQAMTARVFRVAGYEEPMDRLRGHSTLTAHVARLVCRETALYDEYAFLCGLLHDIGMAASLIAMASSATQSKRPPDFEVVWPAVCEIHEEAGAKLTSIWKLPADIGRVIGSHHGPRANGPVHPLAAVVRVSAIIASELGRDVEGEPTGNDGWAHDALKLSSSARAAVVQRAKELVERSA